MVAVADDPDALRSAVVEVARTRRRVEQLEDRPWSVAYLWTIETAPRRRGLLGSLVTAFKPGPSGPVLEVARQGEGSYAARTEDGSAISAPTLSELNDLARQRFAPAGAATVPDAITLYEVVHLPADTAPTDGS